MATAVVHPFASSLEKTWPAGHFAAVAEHLKQSGFEPVFIGSRTDDFAPFAAYSTLRGASLSEIKSLLAGASLFIGNDSGPAHMAAAFGLPMVVIFSASNPAIWGPWKTTAEVVQSPATVAHVSDALHRVKAAAV
jgi:ADP-heptose:LPS heptosyltransferase